MSVQMVNLQRFSLTLYLEDGSLLKLPAHISPPQVNERLDKLSHFNGQYPQIPIFTPAETSVINMPTLSDDILYIATILVASTAKLPNVVSPINAVRNSNGEILGFRGLKSWH